MKKNIFSVILFILVSFSLSAGNTTSKNSKVENGYEIHYNAFSTDFLTKDVAKSYQIGRSKTKGMINIAVLKQQQDGISTAVEANITLKAQNLYGQNKSITLRKISENDGAIYYIGTFSVSSRETINFKASVLANGARSPIEIKFHQEFFTD